jgi:pimeloyl-ACP methyl ester carboxylesterase
MDRHGSFLRMRSALGRDVRVLLYDRRGYGRSVEAGAAPLDGHAADLLELLDGRPAVVVGHSFGGLVALRATEIASSGLVRALVVWETPLSWLPSWPTTSAGAEAIGSGDPGQAAETFLRRMIGDETWEAMPDVVKDRRRAEGPALVTELRSARLGQADLDVPPPVDLAAVRVPVVVGRGTRAKPHHRAGVDHLVAALTGAPTVELIEIDGATHGAHISHPQEFAGLVRRGLELANGQ